MDNALKPQPDFAITSNTSKELSTDKIPALNNGAQILETIARLQRQVEGLQRNVEGLERGINQRFDQMDVRIATSEFNNMARLSNSFITHNDSSLEPLRRVTDKLAHSEFP
ncbi:hypothetical protein K432DRAFT_425936 [Lepidopterella palustris CBS 459.81]|uniref:Uncharacterized protein n=1 Tax=Lepidopterella palustris CBS 459.81 TaxID=1314670 RepID=A0A8E2JF89_9PEZI|nr:hypothetical protein K432DRAFT_425936 [Lepidopterella palustris CBS 459.81]